MQQEYFMPLRVQRFRQTVVDPLLLRRSRQRFAMLKAPTLVRIAKHLNVLNDSKALFRQLFDRSGRHL
ncbi:hypothetical protein D3C81_1245190 [compost metagenome]